MDLKDAVELYREVLRRYSQGFSLEEVLGSVAEALGGECAVFFVRKELSSFLEPRLAWNVSEADKERIDGRLIPMDWVARQPARRYIVVEREKLSELGLEGVCRDPSGVAVMFPVRSHAHLRAALLTVIPDRVSLPDQQSYRAAAVAAVLTGLVQAFGAPLLANQSLQFELADLAADLDMVRHHNWAAVDAAVAERYRFHHVARSAKSASISTSTLRRPAWVCSWAMLPVVLSL